MWAPAKDIRAGCGVARGMGWCKARGTVTALVSRWFWLYIPVRRRWPCWWCWRWCHRNVYGCTTCPSPSAPENLTTQVPRCLEFATAKANLRNMRHDVALLVGDLLQDHARLPPLLARPAGDGTFSVVLDSSTFHCFCDADRERYVATLRRLLRPGGVIYMNCMSEEETRPGGPR